jgi:UDP-glucose 4-epimerase
MKIGITGGAGFIGGWTAAVALEHGHDVVIMDRRARPLNHPAIAPELVKINEADSRLELFLGDVIDPVSMAELGAHVDGIIHLAACLGTQETIQNPRPAALTNIVGGLNFLETVAQYGIAGCYIGVGNHWMQNTYSISKTTVERFVHMFNTERGTKVNIVRAVNAYGPGQSMAPPFGPAKVRKITPAFIARALTGAPIEVYGDGSQISDMVHVRDVAEALVRALEASYAGKLLTKLGGHRFETVPVEVGPAESADVNMVAEEVIAASLRFLKPGELRPVEHLPMRPGETPGAVVKADTSTLALLGMDPAQFTPLGEGMRETVAWYAEHWLPEYRAKLAEDVRRAEAEGK